ncbi:MAG: DnaB-like helicase N-terminal domain-containing protein, partial [Arcobacteraceae bacterium]
MDYIKNQDSVSNLNIEKAILGTILFDPNLFSDVFGILSVDNFTHNEYKKIFATMQDLEKHNIPIDDEMIKRKSSQAIDENVLVELLGVNPVSNIVEYAKELKKDTLARQIYITTIELQQKFDIKLIDKLQNLKDELENVDSIKKLKKTDTLDSFFDKIDLDYKKVEEAKFEYLLDNFIVKNEITMIAARPNIGKSLTTFAAANMVLENKSITTVFYLDGDNGI